MKTIFCALLAALSFLAGPVYGADIGFGETYSFPYSLQSEKNIYAAAESVLISGSVNGDAVVAGANAVISGAVTGDTLVAGGAVEILSPVSGDVRILGGQLTVANTVGSDLVAAGGNVTVLSGSAISGDVIVVGGKVSLMGSISGNVYAAGKVVYIDGRVLGNVKVYSAGTVKLGPNAVIGGDFVYHSSQKAIIDSQASVKGEIRQEYVGPIISASDARGFFTGLFGAAFILRIIVLIVLALFLVLVFRRMSVGIVNQTLENYWKKTLIGLIVFVAVPFASLLVAITVIGGLVSVTAMTAWLLMLFVANAYAGVIFAGVISKFLLRKPIPPVIPWYYVVLGVLGVNIMCLIPLIGMIAFIIFMFAAFGSLSHMAYRHFLVSR